LNDCLKAAINHCTETFYLHLVSTVRPYLKSHLCNERVYVLSHPLKMAAFFEVWGRGNYKNSPGGGKEQIIPSISESGLPCKSRLIRELLRPVLTGKNLHLIPVRDAKAGNAARASNRSAINLSTSTRACRAEAYRSNHARLYPKTKLATTSWLIVSFGEHQVMAQLSAKRVFIAPLINKGFPVRHPLRARGNFASANLNHQK
jgi:hypothetical protein